MKEIHEVVRDRVNAMLDDDRLTPESRVFALLDYCRNIDALAGGLHLAVSIASQWTPQGQPEATLTSASYRGADE